MGSKKKEVKEKPLEKMTATELRDVAKAIPGIVGAHGMNKSELIAEIKASRGIADAKPKRADSTVREIKKKIKDLRAKRAEALTAEDKRMTQALRRRISRLKKKTRRAA